MRKKIDYNKEENYFLFVSKKSLLYFLRFFVISEALIFSNIIALHLSTVIFVSEKKKKILSVKLYFCLKKYCITIN